MKNNNIIFGLIAAVLLIGGLFMLVNLVKDDNFQEKLLGIDYSKDGNELELDYDTKNPVVALYIENYGSVVIELLPEYAHNTVNSFIKLVRGRFYDNNSIHRLMPGFVLQGGDPQGNGSGGPGYSIKGEFEANGVKNDLKHTKGVVSMARTDSSMDSAGSQFFIMLGTAEYLDGQYAAFGKVIAGMDLVERIEKNEQVTDSESGKLSRNLVIKKAVVDLNDYEYNEPEIIAEE